MKNILKIIEVVILAFTLFWAVKIGREQISVNQRLVNIESANQKPILVFIEEREDPFKFVNIGKGPALNISLYQGNTNGAIMTNKDESILTALGSGEGVNTGTISQKQLSLVLLIEQLEKTEKNCVHQELKSNISRGSNWLALVYRDIEDEIYITTIFGEIDDFNDALVYKKLNCD